MRGSWQLQHAVFRCPTLHTNPIVCLRTGLLSYKPYWKPSAKKIALHPSSCHARSIRQAWPRVELQRSVKKWCTPPGLWKRQAAVADQVESIPTSNTPTREKDLKTKAFRFWLVLPYFRGFGCGHVKASLTNVSSIWSGVLGKVIGENPEFIACLFVVDRVVDGGTLFFFHFSGLHVADRCSPGEIGISFPGHTCMCLLMCACIVPHMYWPHPF